MEPFLFPDELPIILDLVASLPRNSKIVEWGSGGSTVKLVQTMRPDQRIISIEHDKEWYDMVSAELNLLQKNNWTFFYTPESPIYKHAIGSPDDENTIGLEDYIIPHRSILDADFYFIDGICRRSIGLMLLAKAQKRDAVILVHDYAQRQIYYNWLLELFPRTERLGTSLLRLYMTE